MVKINSYKGLSLVEVLISIVIMGIIVGAMFPFFVRIQQKQMLASNVSVLFQGALASFETRRLHTLSRNYNGNTGIGTFNAVTGLPTATAGAPAGVSVLAGCIFESLRNEVGYYAMSKEEIMPFAVVHSFNGPNIDWIFGNYTSCTNVQQNSTYGRSESIPVYNNNVKGYHRVFFFTSEVVCLVSLTQTECNARLTASNFLNDNVSAVVQAATLTGFGRHRNAFVFTPNGSSSVAASATVNIGNQNPNLYKGVEKVLTARNTIINLANSAAFNDRKLFRIKTHHISGVYEWPGTDTGHV